MVCVHLAQSPIIGLFAILALFFCVASLIAPFSQKLHTKIPTVWLSQATGRAAVVVSSDSPHTSYRKIATRHDFENFRHSGPPFDLYIQCQQQFMSTDEGDIQSYYQVARLHGSSDRLWREAEDTSVHKKLGVHGSILFPIWHRPYLALYEQILNKCARSLAVRYPDAERHVYVKAADDLRLPYWDWAAKPQLPQFVTEEYCEIQTPVGRKMLINPLHQYNFPPGAKEFNEQVENSGVPSPGILDHTVRKPNSNWISQPDRINMILSEIRLRSRTLNLYSNCNYSWFSTIAYWRESPTGDSLENIHNFIHDAIGGHMNSSLAAFDPLFWLHHANLDRLFALWQAVCPGSFVNQTLPLHINDSIAMITEETPLSPFIHRNGIPYTATSTRNIENFNYTYAELLWQSYNNTMKLEDVARHVRAALDKLYGDYKV